MRSNLRAMWTMLRLAFEASPGRVPLGFALNVALSAMWALIGLTQKFIVDAAAAGDGRRIVVSCAGAAVLAGVTLQLTYLNNAIRLVVHEKTRELIERRMIELAAAVPTLEHYERSDYVNELELLRQQRANLAQVVDTAMALIGTVLGLAAMMGILVRVHALLLALPLFGLVPFFTSRASERIQQRSFDDSVERERLGRHLFELATSPPAGKELRVFGLRDELVRRHHEVSEEVNRIRSVARVRSSLLSSVGTLTFAVAYVVSVALVASLAVGRRAAPGDVLLVVVVASQISNRISQLISLTMGLLWSRRSVDRFLWLRDYAASARRLKGSSPSPDRLERGIVIENLSFRYPGTDPLVLDDVNLSFRAGTTVALVGENGAGKTTLVKLLCRFYEPTDGRIAVDGTDLRDLDVDDWRHRTSAGFQDFAKLELIARETVGVGDLQRIDQPPEVEAALVRAHATDVVDGLPAGLETQLGKSFEGGLDLSGGQWQKLALGRAMMRETPLLLLLDEPTASLDAETEHALFERYAGAARRVGAENGAITVLVSHRFSTVRMADVIVVLDQGRVVEVGSHDELMRKRALYAELYTLQAKAYR